MVRTIDCAYTDQPDAAAAYLVREGNRAAFVETNTALAVPRLLAALADEGLAPEQVEYVIITHVHLDHAGGASALMQACQNAVLLAHPRAARHAIDPTKLVASATAVYGAERFRALYGEILPIDPSRVRTVADGETVRLGSRELVFLHTRGHANHHAVIHDRSADGVFTGDAFGIRYPALQTDGRFLFPSTSPTDFDAAEAKASLDRIVGTGASRVWLTHFGEYTDLAPMAAEMHAQLDAYGALLEEADATLEDTALDAFCEVRVRAFFDALFAAHPGADTPENRDLLAIDVDLNAQGIAAAVRKRRFKSAR